MKRRELLDSFACIAVAGTLGIGTRAAAQAPRRLVFIHGRAQEGRNPDVLKREWLAALERGAQAAGRSIPNGLDVAFPYYGDTLADLTERFNLPLASDLRARGSAVTDEFLVFQAEFADAVRQRAGVTDAQVDAEYGDNPKPRGPLNWEWVQAILRAVDKHSPGMGQKSLETFTRDVFLYTTRETVRDAIDTIVAGALTTEPTVVVSHSLGTVVAYNILRSDPRALSVPTFVTLGSPLAVRTVRDKFRPLKHPAPVGAWYNAFDRRDVVALYPLDADNFPVTPAITNNDSVRNSTSNRHGIAGYLDDRDVAQVIIDALG